MNARLNEYINPSARVYWPGVIVSGLGAGAISWLLSHGIPWFTSGIISPTLMGRDLKAPGTWDPYASGLTVLAQVLVSIAYGVVICPAVTKLRGMYAISLGVAIGALLFGLNFLFFHLIVGQGWTSTEWPVLATHLVFGAVAAGLYKGLAAQRQVRDEPESLG